MVKETWENSSALPIVDRIFQGGVDEHLAEPMAFVRKCQEHFLEHLKEFPSIDVAKTAPNRFVRARCMVQDVHGVEFFPVACKVTCDESETHYSGFLRDSFVAEDGEMEPSSVILGRHRYLMVPVPGATAWWNHEWNGTDDVESAEEKRACEGCPPEQIEKFIAKIVSDEELLPNTIWEIFGIVGEPFAETNGDEKTLKADVLPHLHVITHRPYSDKAEYRHSSDETLALLKNSLAAALGGDDCPAYYVMMNMISSTYARPGGLPICSLPINICNIENSETFVNIIRQLLPRVLHVPLTPELLSDTPFAPVKDYDSDRLKQGLFQVAEGTTLILDETTLPEGNFPVRNYAEANCRTMERVLLSQQLEYDYGFYKLPFNVDMPIIIISKKTSRLVQTPWRVYIPSACKPLQCAPSDLTRLRTYIQHCRNTLKDLGMDAGGAKYIQDAFVEMAAGLDPAKEDKGETLHQMLILCRLIAKLYGNMAVDREAWAIAQALEERRREMMAKLPAA